MANLVINTKKLGDDIHIVDFPGTWKLTQRKALKPTLSFGLNSLVGEVYQSVRLLNGRLQADGALSDEGDEDSRHAFHTSDVSQILFDGDCRRLRFQTGNSIYEFEMI